MPEGGKGAGGGSEDEGMNRGRCAPGSFTEGPPCTGPAECARRPGWGAGDQERGVRGPCHGVRSRSTPTDPWRVQLCTPAYYRDAEVLEPGIGDTRDGRVAKDGSRWMNALMAERFGWPEDIGAKVKMSLDCRPEPRLYCAAGQGEIRGVLMRGWVRHTSNRECRFENGKRDAPPASRTSRRRRP